MFFACGIRCRPYTTDKKHTISTFVDQTDVQCTLYLPMQKKTGFYFKTSFPVIDCLVDWLIGRSTN